MPKHVRTPEFLYGNPWLRLNKGDSRIYWVAWDGFCKSSLRRQPSICACPLYSVLAADSHLPPFPFSLPRNCGNVRRLKCYTEFLPPSFHALQNIVMFTPEIRQSTSIPSSRDRNSGSVCCTSPIEPCIANDRRASNGSPDSQAPAGITRLLAMQTSISLHAMATGPIGTAADLQAWQCD